MKPLFLPSVSLLALFLISPSVAQETKTIYVTPKIEKELGLGDRYALLIGIGKYKDKRIPSLNYTVADAKAMYGILTDPRHGRFSKEKVRLLLDEGATGDAIKKGFTWLRQNARAEDTVVIFYSGHGAPEEENTYWVSYDADIDDLFATAVGNDIITRQLSQIRAKRLITFLDSCYSAAIVEKKDKPKALFDQDFFAKYKGEGRVSITASDGKELSLESKDLGHGVFTYYLVEALKGKADKNQDGAVELEEVWDHVKQRVTDEAHRRGNKQRPNLIGQMTAGLLVSLNPGVLEVEKARLEELKKLFLKKEITAPEYDEAERVLGGEGDRRLLDLVRRLAEGKLVPADYRLARPTALAGRPGPKPPEKRERPSPPVENLLVLLDKADSQFSRRRYTSPKGDNAYETLQEIIRLDPGNERALKKLQEMGEIYRGWGKEDFGKKSFARAKQHYQKVLSIFPEDREAQDQLAAIDRAEREEGETKVRQERERRERERVAVAPPAMPHERSFPPDNRPIVFVPAGEFIMGDNRGDGKEDERPSRRVYLDAFYVDQYPVTNEDYRRFMEATGHRKPDYWNKSNFNGPKQPVVGINWDDAASYCRWAGKRLPTEAEWEKAARGPDGRKYPWGNEWDGGKAIWFPNSGGKTHPVDRTDNTHRSPYGAVDMAGHVWQWVLDWYDSGSYTRGENWNPKGPAGGTHRVLRGESLKSCCRDVRPTVRHRSPPTASGIFSGTPVLFISVRCARTP